MELSPGTSILLVWWAWCFFSLLSPQIELTSQVLHDNLKAANAVILLIFVILKTVSNASISLHQNGIFW